MGRLMIALACVLAACGDDGGAACTHEGISYSLGDVFPKGDGCNSCSCTASGVACTKQACADAGVDAPPGFCGATGGCPSGPACGVRCCGQGERCEAGACTCGMNAACGSGNSCEAAGPIGGDQCGVVCCGATGPCPQ
jgi:hypothetical protein